LLLYVPHSPYTSRPYHHSPLLLLSFFFPCYGHHRDLHSFPTRRSSDLRSCRHPRLGRPRPHPRGRAGAHAGAPPGRRRADEGGADRKSTRLNSSHVSISYAVFCLKKKKTTTRKGASPEGDGRDMMRPAA